MPFCQGDPPRFWALTPSDSSEQGAEPKPGKAWPRLMSATERPCPGLLPRLSCSSHWVGRHMLCKARDSCDSPRKRFSNLPRGGLSYDTRHPCVLNRHISPLLSGQHRRLLYYNKHGNPSSDPGYTFPGPHSQGGQSRLLDPRGSDSKAMLSTPASYSLSRPFFSLPP